VKDRKPTCAKCGSAMEAVGVCRTNENVHEGDVRSRAIYGMLAALALIRLARG